MSKLSTRIGLAIVISLVVVAGVYFSVQALSSTVARRENMGMYVLNASLTSPLRKETAQESSQPELKTYPDGEGGEGGCESEGDNSSDL